MDYTVLTGRGHKLARVHKIKKLPHLFILDPEGVIHTSEPSLKAEDIKKQLDSLFAELD